jgi:ABC-type transport system substrate-binding protein
MRKIVMLALGVVFLSTAFAGVALAQTTTPAPTAPAPATTGQYPSVATLKPFATEADYMSLAGYLRYLVFQQTSQWLTRPEADRVVDQQRGL